MLSPIDNLSRWEYIYHVYHLLQGNAMAKLPTRQITLAAESASKQLERFSAVEEAARQIHEASVGTKFARAMLNGGGLHVLLTDNKTTVEICDGKMVVSVASEEDREEEGQ
jgi:hypothetical protein